MTARSLKVSQSLVSVRSALSQSLCTVVSQSSQTLSPAARGVSALRSAALPLALSLTLHTTLIR